MVGVTKHLTHLEASGLIHLVQTHPELEYLFRHSLIQKAAYNSLLLEDRKQLHRQVGKAIEQTYPDRLEELAAILVQHFVKAGEVEKARRMTNQQTRLELYRQADRILVNEAVIMPLTYGRLHLLIKPWISKFPRSRSSDWHWKDVIIEPH